MIDTCLFYSHTKIACPVKDFQIRHCLETRASIAVGQIK